MKKILQRLVGFSAIGLLAATIASGQSIYSTPYTFATLAGATNGVAGGNDGTNSGAQFNGPQDVAVDGAGNVYVADTENNTIRKLAHAGTNWVVTTIAGMVQNPGFADGTNLDAQFSSPSAIAVDINSNLYVADAGNNTIRKITPSGTNWVTTTIAGSAEISGFADGTNSTALFSFPSGITVDTNGNLYVSDTDNSIIRKITLSGTNWVTTTIAGSVGNFGSSDGIGTNALFFGTANITVDANGNLYVVDVVNDTIRKITPVVTNWMVSTIAGQVGSAGFNDGTNLAAQFSFESDAGVFVPSGISSDSAGNLYVADTGNGTIRKMTPSGTNWVTTTLAGVVGSVGSTDGTGTNALFNSPEGIAADGAGNLYVADTGNNTIRKGQVQIASVPNLAVFLTATNSVVVSWPNLGSYTLQTNADLTTTNWAGYGGGVATATGTNSVTISPPAGNLFFRLTQ
jgi:sugar lactone lactonase YvrE